MDDVYGSEIACINVGRLSSKWKCEELLTPRINKTRQKSEQGQTDADPEFNPASDLDERTNRGKETTDDVKEEISTGWHWCCLRLEWMAKWWSLLVLPNGDILGLYTGQTCCEAILRNPTAEIDFL